MAVEKLNTRQAFWLIYAHATAQRVKSEEYHKGAHETFCRLRCGDGRKCFFGALIPDELYSQDMEGKTPGKVLELFPTLAERLEGVDFEFLDRMVWIHDKHEPEDWTGLLESVRINEGWPI
jgi:hypothetical protein